MKLNIVFSKTKGVNVDYNMKKAIRDAIKATLVAEKFPCSITYLGFEAGATVITGGTEVIGDEKDALSIAMKAHGSEKGRNSWDPMTVMLYLCENEEKAGFATVFGDVFIDENGCNYFEENNSSDRCYVVKKHPDYFYENGINSRISVDKKA